MVFITILPPFGGRLRTFVQSFKFESPGWCTTPRIWKLSSMKSRCMPMEFLEQGMVDCVAEQSGPRPLFLWESVLQGKGVLWRERILPTLMLKGWKTWSSFLLCPFWGHPFEPRGLSAMGPCADERSDPASREDNSRESSCCRGRGHNWQWGFHQDMPWSGKRGFYKNPATLEWMFFF